MTTRAILYVRVSTDEQVEHGYSIPEQRRELLAYAEAEGWVVVDVIVDEGHSGAVGVRPGLDRIMQLAEAGEIDLVLAKKRNRLFRDRYIRMGYERALLEHGVRLVALDDAGHRLADAVMDEFGDWFREEVTKNTVAGRMEKAREGKLIRTHTPIYGFEYTPDGTGFEVVPSRMAVVERIIRSVAAGSPLHAVKRDLEADGVPAPGGGVLWGVKTVREIVREDAYRPVPYPELEPLLSVEARARLDKNGEYGVVWYPRRKVKSLDPDPERGYRRPQKVAQYPRSEQVPIPVVSSGIQADLIDAARLAIEQNRPSRRSANGRVYELAGIVRCAECGNVMATNRKVNGGNEYFYYRCARYQRDGLKSCTMNRSFPAQTTERKVLHAVLDAVKDRDELIRGAREGYEEERRRILRPGSTDVARLKREIDDLEGQRMEFFRQRARGRLTDERLDALISEVDGQQDRLDRLVQEYEDREHRLGELEAGLEKTVDLIRRGKWNELGITEPQRRNARYREIGLSAQASVDGTLRLSWRFGEEATVGTQDLTSRADLRARTGCCSAGSWCTRSG